VVPGQQPLNVSKTKELIVDHKKRRDEQSPINIDGSEVERVESFKFLGVHVTNKLTWSKHTMTVVKRTGQHLLPLEELKRFGMGPQIHEVIQLHHREHPDRLHCLIVIRQTSTSLGPSFLRTYIQLKLKVYIHLSQIHLNSVFHNS
jgi:hypothetical protein